MLIPVEDIKKILDEKKINITGVLHLGAHECEELEIYNKLGIKDDDVMWIDAIDEKVELAKTKGVKNIYKAVITDVDNNKVWFNHANNGQSSSVLELDTHLKEHPRVHYTKRTLETTITIDTFLKKHNLYYNKYNFWNFDIQGAELLALKGARKALLYAKVLYLEVNTDYLYKDCALMTEIDEFVKPYGFSRVLTNITKHKWGDALYIKDCNDININIFEHSYC